MTNIDIYNIVSRMKNEHPLFDTPLSDGARLALNVLILNENIKAMFQPENDVSRETLLAALGEVYKGYYALLIHFDMTLKEVEEFIIEEDRINR